MEAVRDILFTAGLGSAFISAAVVCRRPSAVIAVSLAVGAQFPFWRRFAGRGGGGARLTAHPGGADRTIRAGRVHSADRHT